MVVQECWVTYPPSEHWTQPQGALIALGNMHDEVLATVASLGFSSTLRVIDSKQDRVVPVRNLINLHGSPKSTRSKLKHGLGYYHGLATPYRLMTSDHKINVLVSIESSKSMQDFATSHGLTTTLALALIQ